MNFNTVMYIVCAVLIIAALFSGEIVVGIVGIVMAACVTVQAARENEIREAKAINQAVREERAKQSH